MAIYFMQSDKTGIAYESSNGKPWAESDIKITKKAYLEWVRKDAGNFLRRKLKPGSKVYTILKHVSASGMRREISVVIANKNEVIELDYHVSKLLDASIGPNGGIICHGCGMDMGFDLVYRLGYHLWPKGTRKPHGTRNGAPDSHGGYALKHAGYL